MRGGKDCPLNVVTGSGRVRKKDAGKRRLQYRLARVACEEQSAVVDVRKTKI